MMSLKSIAFVLSVVLTCLTIEVFAEEAINKLEVKVYYEALCPGSVEFITNQLRPSMTDKARLAYANLQFVPYGNVVIHRNPKTNRTSLRCQHGRRECQLNAQHACFIENNTEQESYDMITCSMARYTYEFDKCAAKYGINLDAAYQCRVTRSIADILNKYGIDTYSVKLSFVPTTSFDGVYDYYEQDEILRNFDGVFCNKYKNKFNVTLAGC